MARELTDLSRKELIQVIKNLLGIGEDTEKALAWSMSDIARLDEEVRHLREVNEQLVKTLRNEAVSHEEQQAALNRRNASLQRRVRVKGLPHRLDAYINRHT